MSVLPPWLQRTLLHSVDALMGVIPRPPPSVAQLEHCRLIAHRGVHDHGQTVHENTIAAFEAALEAGAWGIEFDLRWTADDVPVVFHDFSCRRVFGDPTAIAETRFEELRRRIPLLPTLEEIITRFGGARVHLMIEVKRTGQPLTETRHAILRRELGKLAPVLDFHLMSLDLDELSRIAKAGLVPPEACVSIAEINVAATSERTLREGWGAFTGQYVLVSDERIRRHHDAGQWVGTGFPSSISTLSRELRRGVDWVFTNHTHELTRLIPALKR